MVKVSDKDSCEPLVVMVKGVTGLEVGLKEAEPLCGVSRFIVI